MHTDNYHEGLTSLYLRAFSGYKSMACSVQACRAGQSARKLRSPTVTFNQGVKGTGRYKSSPLASSWDNARVCITPNFRGTPVQLSPGAHSSDPSFTRSLLAFSLHSLAVILGLPLMTIGVQSGDGNQSSLNKGGVIQTSFTAIKSNCKVHGNPVRHPTA